MRQLALILAAVLGGVWTLAGPALAQQRGGAPDYGDTATWLCRPGDEAVCTTKLDAMAVRADGSRTFQPFQPAVDPPIDCFYVYPTASHEESDLADMTATPDITETTRGQAGRLSAHCRVFAPIYRQLTLPGLRRQMEAGKARDIDWTPPYRDVQAAWRWYMAHENHGRGVVLVGHSQGAILLQRLIAEEIDGRPAQRLLVSAFLAGDPVLPVPAGARVGGVFKSVPLCAAAAETGCAYVWSDYLSSDTEQPRVFARNLSSAVAAGCDSPAAPGGGTGELKAYLHRPAIAPESDPPWVEVLDQLSGACTDDGSGHVVQVTIQPSRYADLLRKALEGRRSSPGWGLHPLDVALLQGNMLDVLAAESATWTARR
jgi:hypothetical protein